MPSRAAKRRGNDTGKSATINDYCVSKMLSVGVIIDRPRILPKQNPSPQGENTVFP